MRPGQLGGRIACIWRGSRIKQATERAGDSVVTTEVGLACRGMGSFLKVHVARDA